MIYRVTEWKDSFENNRTRELKKVNWVPIPNKQDGDGYTVLVEHKNGAAHLGAWLSIVQIASKCDPRGTLVRDNGKPHDAATLARMSRLPVKIYEEVLPRLIDDEIGWLEIIDSEGLAVDIDTMSQDVAGSSQDVAQKERKNGMNEYSKSFLDFWEYYPRNVGKKNAYKSWSKQNLDDRCQELITAIQRQSETIFKGKELKYIPHCATWLNGARWEDDCTVKPVKRRDISEVI